MDQCEQLTFRRRNLAIDGVSKLILSSAPIKSRKRTADRETLAHADQTGFPRRIRIGDAVAWRNDIPLLPLAPYSLKECDRTPVHVVCPAHSAARPCCELSTGRRALWIG